MRKITITFDEDEWKELSLFTAHRHVGGRFPETAFAKEAIFSYMAKYPIPEAKRARLEESYGDTTPDAKAAQL